MKDKIWQRSLEFLSLRQGNCFVEVGLTLLSAKDNINVEDAFFHVVRQLRKMYKDTNKPEKKKCNIL